jgi:hypothetical protein
MKLKRWRQMASDRENGHQRGQKVCSAKGQGLEYTLTGRGYSIVYANVSHSVR